MSKSLNKKKGRILIKVVAAMGIVLSMGTKVMAQADPYDPSSPNYVGNSTKVKRPRFNGTIAMSAFRGLDEFSEEGAYYEGVLGFYINDNLRGDVTAGYSHPFDLDAERTDRWEFEDVTLRLLKPSVWKSDSKNQNVALIGSLGAPLSGTSQDASLYSSVRLAAQYSYRFSKFTLAATPSLRASYHEFETADENGFLKNTPLSLGSAVSLRWGITRKIGIVAATSLTTLFDYDFNNTNVQAFSGSVQYAVNKKTFLSLSARWRDRVVTNNALFDDDASAASLTLVYIL